MFATGEQGAEGENMKRFLCGCQSPCCWKMLCHHLHACWTCTITCRNFWLEFLSLLMFDHDSLLTNLLLSLLDSFFLAYFTALFNTLISCFLNMTLEIQSEAVVLLIILKPQACAARWIFLTGWVWNELLSILTFSSLSLSPPFFTICLDCHWGAVESH